MSDVPSYVVTQSEFDHMPIVEIREAYDTRKEGVRFRYSNGRQWGTIVSGREHVLYTEREYGELMGYTDGVKRSRSLHSQLSKNQLKKRRQKARRK